MSVNLERFRITRQYLGERKKGQQGKRAQGERSAVSTTVVDQTSNREPVSLAYELFRGR